MVTFHYRRRDGVLCWTTLDGVVPSQILLHPPHVYMIEGFGLIKPIRFTIRELLDNDSNLHELIIRTHSESILNQLLKASRPYEERSSN